MILVDGLSSYSAKQTRGLPSQTWCHMVSDTSEAELHAFAARVGLNRVWAQLKPHASAAHYDLTPQRRAIALQLGAVAVTARELVERNYDRARRRPSIT